jgi:hypothetical protein
MFGKTIFVTIFLWRINCAWNAVTDKEIHHIFDTTIKQFVRQFAQMEPVSSSSSNSSIASDQSDQQQQQQLMNLSFINAAHILREIEEAVANKFMKKCTAGHQNDDEIL